MAATNNRLLISESRSDSNRCTPCRGKPDQHATRFSRSVRVWSMTIHISHGPHIATSHTTVNRFEQIYCTQLIFHNILWSSGKKSSFCWQPTTRLTGPISPTCDRYIQYLLMGANPSVLNRDRWGLQSWRCHLATYPLPDLPNQLSPHSPRGPVRSPFWPSSSN
jgi:hypothetical protein